jgi:alkanesulfonate monooxygenase SsuD/methylene tetrahydromethanopterin reductase-like flavin-dependent oxidoreductase (luciferase family)
MKVGFVLPMSAEMGDGGTWAGIAALARQAEAGGADSLWAFDHFLYRWPGRDVDEGSHDAFTLLAGAAAITERVALGTLVAATSFRSPGVLAKAAATLDLVAPGRIVLGLGCGWHEPEYRAFGYPFDHRVGRFEEAVSIIRPLLDGERVTFQGRWHTTEEAVLAPPPGSRVPLLIAADGPRMQSLTARFADGWQAAWFGLPSARFRDERDRLLVACAAAGRATERAPEVHTGVRVSAHGGERALALDPAAIADGLAAWEAEGVHHVQLWVEPVTTTGVALALEGLRRFRG